MNDERIFGTRPTIATEGHLERGYQVGAVYKTDDLSIFNFSKFNREKKKKKRMIEEAEKGQLVAPIIVNENFTVIDGQHRLKAAMEAGAPIEYVVKPGLNKDDIVRMNTIQKKWSLADYIEAYSSQGIDSYYRLADLMSKKVISITSLVKISTNRTGNANAMQIVKDGEFEFFNYDKAVEFLSFYKRFNSKTGTPKRAGVAEALYKMFKYSKIDRNRLIKKVVSTGLNEELKVKNLTYSDTLRNLLDSYNNKYAASNKGYVNYHIASTGSIVIDEQEDKWAEN